MPSSLRRAVALLALAAAPLAPAPLAAAPRCAWPVAAETLYVAGDTLHRRWTFPASALPDAASPDDLPALRDFRAAIAAALGDVDPRALLRRQADHWSGRANAAERREAENGRAVLDGAAGTLAPVGCLEALLVEAQAARFPMTTRPTELQALVLRRGPDLRVYMAGSGAPWPPKLAPVDAAVARDRADGWTVAAHVHNHPFYLDKRDADVAGANAPSLSDVQFWRSLRASLGLEGAWVTNGFTTARFAAADFDRLRAAGAGSTVAAPDTALARLLQARLDSLRAAARFPGATLALALADGRVVAVATGLADTARRIPLRTTDRLLQGSVGKTYVAAVAMQLVAEGKLDLEAPIARWLGDAPWFARLPNARQITVRQLMTHTSGLVRYEFDPRATAVLRAEPMKTWTPEERLSYLLDTQAPFAAGAGWDYSDTNYIVLGMILERITGRPYYEELRRRVLVPLALTNTIPSDRPDLPGLANGYAGPQNDLGGYDASLDANGRLRVNPQFEWTGGGIASTTADLARWGKLLYEGRAFDAALLPRMLDGVPARLGRDVRYGLGVMLRPTALGVTWGHSGFFPGYATELLYFPELKVAAAIQVNATAPYPRGLVPFLVEAVRTATATR